jgi:hypothetical protein
LVTARTSWPTFLSISSPYFNLFLSLSWIDLKIWCYLWCIVSSLPRLGARVVCPSPMKMDWLILYIYAWDVDMDMFIAYFKSVGCMFRKFTTSKACVWPILTWMHKLSNLVYHRHLTMNVMSLSCLNP